MSPPHPPPPLLSSSSLRLATLNIGLGFTRKLPDVLDRCLALSLDVIALQEIGDPALTRTIHSQYIFIASPGPSAHEAGVGLLISHDLAPRCRAYKRSSSGRLVGVILELSKGHQLLIVSAYMPTGLDQQIPADLGAAHLLYREMLSWSRGVQQVICMGDLNETLTALDRYPTPTVPRSHAAAKPIQCLIDEGFTDVYRHLHPLAARQPGFTHLINSLTRCTRSRIDYIWSRGASTASFLDARIDSKLVVSHHRLLWMELHLPHEPSPPCTRDLYHSKLPDLRDLEEVQIERFVVDIENRMNHHEHYLQTLADTLSETSLSQLASELTSIAHRSAFAKLPRMGSKPLMNKTVLQLHRQRRDLSRLIHYTTTLLGSGLALTRSPDWARLHQHCVQQHQLQWSVNAYYDHDDAAWLMETRRFLSRTRSSIRREQYRLAKGRSSYADDNRAAAIHRMLESDALPSQLYSVIDAKGELTTNAEELEQVMVDHFESVFAIPPLDHCPLLPPPPSMLFDKSSIMPEWYEGLMEEVTDGELLALVADVPLVSAAGQDEVSTGVWKLAITGSEVVRRHVATLFSSCLLTVTFPSAWKTSIIIPFVKDALKDRTMNNIRPISLQSCLGKLFSKLLAYRLGEILQRHPILNPAQRGFVLGGTTMKCIDELLDAWDWSRNTRGELYTLFYDIKQAYDSVQAHVLERAMNRLRLPKTFIKLIVSSLTGLSSCVRTVFGVTRIFAVLRSVRQGDPLAPLLFIILMDALHDGLELNPFTQQRHGCTLSYPKGDMEIPSLGYADDTAVITNSLEDLRIQNDWVQYFMRFNVLRLNPLKCELVGRGHDGNPVKHADIIDHGIAINGVSLIPLQHDHPIRYLGVHTCFDGSWLSQQKKALSMIMKFSRLATKFQLSIGHAVYMFNVFLVSRLELALHYVHGPGTSAWIKKCNRCIIGCIKHLAESPIQLSHSALALSLHLVLPSWLEISIKVSELFLRVNSSDPRWGELGRIIMRSECPPSIDHSTVLPRPDSGTRMTRAVVLAVKTLSWSLHLRQQHHARSRHRHLYDTASIEGLPTLADCTSTSLIQLSRGSTHIAHDIWRGWNAGAAVSPLVDVVHIYTDGSFDPFTSSSAWSVVIGDQWLDDNFGSVPSDEKMIQSAHLGGSTLIGSGITTTAGVYPAELQAIARALAMFPLRARLFVHSDSQASIAAINSFSESMNERKRLRSSARTLLQLISHLLTLRQQAGGGLTLKHIRAHTTDMTIHSVGNRMADFQANLARVKFKDDWTYPLGLKQLPLESCEYHLHIKSSDGLVVIDDIRRVSHVLQKSLDLDRWKSKPAGGQGRFAGAGVMDLGRVALRCGSPDEQITFVHVSTNSIHYHLVSTDHRRRSSSVKELQCTRCKVTMTLDHVSACPDGPCMMLRRAMHSDILGLFDGFEECRRWQHAMDRSSLRQLLLSLFPPAVSAATPAAEVDDHFIRCFIGSFTQQQCMSAINRLNIKELQDGRQVPHQVRLRCLKHIGSFYTKLKSDHG